MSVLWGGGLVLTAALAWGLNFLTLPGNWVVVLLVALYAQFGPAEGRVAIGWGVVIVLIGLAVVGEAVELLTGSVAAARAGGSKRGAACALLGSLVGALVGVFVGVPIPVVGPLLGALLFAGLGAWGGAILGEQWAGRELDESWRIGEVAFWSRMLGTLGKSIVGAAMVALILIAVVL